MLCIDVGICLTTGTANIVECLDVLCEQGVKTALNRAGRSVIGAESPSLPGFLHRCSTAEVHRSTVYSSITNRKLLIHQRTMPPLSQDIITLIAKALPDSDDGRKDLISVALVSTLSTLPAQTLLFQSITIQYPEGFHVLLQVLERNPRLRTFVKCVTIQNDDSENYDKTGESQ
jgi:hypothetical protein